MSILASAQKQKQNYKQLQSSGAKFYPRVKRRQSQMGKINEMVFSQKLLQNISIKSPNKLNHFKKNNNKIQSNIQQGIKEGLKSAKENSNQNVKFQKNSPPSYQSTIIGFRRSQNDWVVNRRRKMCETSTNGFKNCYKTKKSNSNKQRVKYNVYPRYKTLELYALYRSILQFSERDPKKFLQAFEAALNYQKVMIKPEILKKSLYQQKQLQFMDFLIVYKKMEDLMFIQSIIDYLQIIFEAHSKQKLKYQTVYQILAKRSEHDEAAQITEIIFKKLSMDGDRKVQLQDILQLCEKDMQFCASFSKLYHKQAI